MRRGRVSRRNLALVVVLLATVSAAWRARWEGNSSLPPKPPPVGVWITRNRVSSRASACFSAFRT